MAKPWHKSWACSLDNPKIQMLTGEQFKAWSNLLWVADRFDEEGRLPEIKIVAFQLRVTPAQALVLIEDQVSLGLIETNGTAFVIHDWRDWQGDGKTDAQRKRVQRSRERDVSRDTSVTNHVTLNGPVASESRDTRARSSSSSSSSLVLSEEGGAGGNPPNEVAALAQRTEGRWPAQNADVFVGDLCKTFDYRLASQILEQAYDKDPKKLPRAWIRKGCQAEMARGWEPVAEPVSGVPGVVTGELSPEMEARVQAWEAEQRAAKRTK
jgi:hypothetical protein